MLSSIHILLLGGHFQWVYTTSHLVPSISASQALVDGVSTTAYPRSFETLTDGAMNNSDEKRVAWTISLAYSFN